MSTVNEKYAEDLENGDASDALTMADGLLVVGFFFEVSDSFSVLDTKYYFYILNTLAV